MGAGDYSKNKLHTYHVPLVVSLFKVGCFAESYLRHCQLREILAYCCLRELPSKATSTYSALASAVKCVTAMIRFDLDSFPIGVDYHASHCMANAPHLFEDLKLTKRGEVKGIKQELVIRGIGTFNFKLKDNDGKTHEIKVPNTLFLPDLKRCLLLPQHWAQEARDNYLLPRGTWMESNEENCILIWGQGKYKKTIPFNPNSNIPIMHLASLSCTYHAFATTFEACEASFFQQEQVLQIPGLRQIDSQAASDEQEFFAEETVNLNKQKSAEVI
jgi:hypothetical protein